MPTGEHLIKHGLSRTRIYLIYRGMLQRVLNPNSSGYKYYGGRGVTICEDWVDKDTGFINFYNWAMANGYSDDLSIDRIEVNGGYAPDNCRWITNEKQQNNKTNSRFVTYNGETKTLAEWSKSLGGGNSLVAERLRLGWGVPEAVTTPPVKINQYHPKDITYKGKTQSLRDWSRELDIAYKTLSGRLRKGWSIERAFSTTPEKKFSTAKRKEG